MTTTQRTPTTQTSQSANGRPLALTTQGLSKRYGRRLVVDGLSLEVPAGAVAGFIGPNGAGKTTTMAMLLGLVTPTAGSGTILGASLDKPASYLGRVGALIETPAFWPGLTGVQNLRALAILGGHDPGRVPEVLDLVGLGPRGADRFGEYSLGMKQRLGIAAALLGDPELLVLDEPTNGLDPAGINEIRQFIRRIADGKRTVLVSSHILSELEQICDWLIVINDGSLVYQGPADEFLGRVPTVIALAPEHVDDLDRLAALVRADGHEPRREYTELVVPVDEEEGRAVAAALNKAALERGIILAELHLRRPSLESQYLATIGGER
ncbi:MAG TPA: ABC transporter ATP-binding protein [Gaiellaceae bacterium]|nr:ABC transporter ATP-binding protein [Gaiellaceae bacterium]